MVIFVLIILFCVSLGQGIECDKELSFKDTEETIFINGKEGCLIQFVSCPNIHIQGTVMVKNCINSKVLVNKGVIRLGGSSNSSFSLDSSILIFEPTERNDIELTQLSIRKSNWKIEESFLSRTITIRTLIDYDSGVTRLMSDYTIFNINFICPQANGEYIYRTPSLAINENIKVCSGYYYKIKYNTIYISDKQNEIKSYTPTIECITYGNSSHWWFGTNNSKLFNLCPCPTDSNCIVRLKVPRVYNMDDLNKFKTKYSLHLDGVQMERISNTKKIETLIVDSNSILFGLYDVQLNKLEINNGYINGEVLFLHTSRIDSYGGYFTKTISNSQLGNVYMTYTGIMGNMNFINATSFVSSQQISVLTNFTNFNIKNEFKIISPLFVNQKKAFNTIDNITCLNFKLDSVLVQSDINSINCSKLYITSSSVWSISNIITNYFEFSKSTFFIVKSVISELLKFDNLERLTGYRNNYLQDSQINILSIVNSTIWFISSVNTIQFNALDLQIREFYMFYSNKAYMKNIYYDTDYVGVFWDCSINQLILESTPRLFLEWFNSNELKFDGTIEVDVPNSVSINKILSSSELLILNKMTIPYVISSGHVTFSRGYSGYLEAERVDIIDGLYNITLAKQMSFTIHELTVSALINTINSPLLIFNELQCNSSIHINPLDFKSPHIQIASAQNCNNQLYIDFSVPTLSSFVVLPNELKLTCNLMGVSSQTFNESWQEKGEEIDFQEWSINNINRCLVDRCLISEKKDEGYYCSNRKNKCYKNCRGVIDDTMFISSVSLKELWVSSKVEKILLNGNDNNFGLILLGNGSNVQFFNNKVYSKNIIGKQATIKVSVNGIIESDLIDVNSIEMNTFSRINSDKINCDLIKVTIDCRIEVKEINIKSITFDNQCDISPNEIIIKTERINSLNLNKEVLISNSVCQSTVNTIDLIFVKNGFDHTNIVGNILFSCNDHLIVSNGNNGVSEVKCGKYGVSDYCYVISRDITNPKSFDLSKSTTTFCPCQNTDKMGCSYIIGTNEVNGKIDAYEVIIEKESVIKSDNMNISVELKIKANSHIYTSSSVIESIYIEPSTILQLDGLVNSHLVNGFGVLRQREGKLYVNDLFNVHCDVKYISISKTFNPLELVLNNSLINLNKRGLFYMNMTTIKYINQQTIPIILDNPSIVNLYNSVISSFPLHQCFELIQIVNEPILYFNNQPTSTEAIFDYELTCSKKIVLLCNNPSKLYQCPTQTCVYNVYESPINSSRGYTQPHCPCGFSDNTLKYSDNGCIIEAKNLNNITTIYGTFHNIKTDNNAIISIHSLTNIKSFEPQSFIRFTGNGFIELSVSPLTKKSYTIHTDVKMNLKHVYSKCSISSTSDLIIGKQENGQLNITGNKNLITLSQNQYNNININISMSHVYLPNGINGKTFILETQGFNNPLMTMTDGKVFSVESFEYKGNDNGVLLETIQNGIDIKLLKRGYVDEDKAILATQEVKRKQIYCKYNNNKWNSTNCPCTGVNCHLIYASTSEIINETIEANEINIFGKHKFNGRITCEKITIDESCSFKEIYVGIINITKENNIEIELYDYEVKYITGINYDIFTYSSGRILQIEASTLHLYLKDTIESKYLNIKLFIIIPTHNDFLFISLLQNGTTTLDNTLIYLPDPLFDKYYILKADEFPPLDTVKTFKRNDSLQPITNMYLTIVCDKYMALIKDINDYQCPYEDTNNQNNSNTIWLIMIPSVICIILIIIVIVLLTIYLHKLFIKRRRFERLF
ncbi:Hypothetical protein EHI5A_051160 [Entamoeba histolytica KU27]|uniref:Uncharacterized protein n=1 Tax=Entamoeba histolytica KU27 TaxID=885311 RepID=M2S5H4_ENTHI|nr:Hypothetical protein EHI5A_051160 [Entamoeba histolytica KU27]